MNNVPTSSYHVASIARYIILSMYGYPQLNTKKPLSGLLAMFSHLWYSLFAQNYMLTLHHQTKVRKGDNYSHIYRLYLTQYNG